MTAFVPAAGDTGLEVRIRGAGLSLLFTLTRVPRADEPIASNNVALLWHQPREGIHSDIWAEDGVVFAPRFDGGIELLDATSGEVLGVTSTPDTLAAPKVVLDVKARDGVLYAATVADGILIFDVSEPSAPELIGQYRVFDTIGSPDNFTDIHNIFLSPDGSLVYAMNQSALHGTPSFRRPKTDLRIIDVSDPAAPEEVGRFTPDVDRGVVHDINVIEQDGLLIAFLNYWDGGLWIFDVTEPGSVEVLSSIAWDGIVSHSGWPFRLHGTLCYAHAKEGYDRHLTVLDVPDLTDPRVVSRFSTRPGVSIHNVEVVEGIAYISYYIDGLRVVDLRDPEHPREIGHFDTVADEDERSLLQGAFGVRVQGSGVYVSDVESGTYAFQVELLP